MNAKTRLAVAFCLVAASLVGLVRPEVASAAPPEGFASPQIRAIWERDDGPVASGAVHDLLRAATALEGAGGRLRDVAPRLHVDARKLDADLGEVLGDSGRDPAGGRGV